MSAVELIEKANLPLQKALQNYHSLQNNDTLKEVVRCLTNTRLFVPGEQHNQQATFSIVHNPDKEPFFLAFTSREELHKFTDKEFVLLTLQQMAEVLQQNPSIKGFVIDIKGSSFILPCKLADRIIASYAMADLARG